MRSQIALALMLAASLAWLWHSDAAFELKAAALAIGSLLATPYVLDYDLVVLAVAIAFFARHGLATAFALTKSACWPRPGSCRCCRASIAGADRHTPRPDRHAGALLFSSCGVRCMDRASYRRRRRAIAQA